MSAAKKIRTSQFENINTSILCPEDNFLLLIQNSDPERNPVNWVIENREYLEAELVKYGSVLLRGFSVGLKNFKDVVEGITENGIMEYKAGYSPRKKLGEKVYTSTIFPSELCINQHQDQCYLPEWPRKLFLCSEIPAAKGGETPLTSVRKFMKLIDPKIVQKISKGVLYIRGYSEASHMKWQDAYWTENKLEVEKICRGQGMKFEWNGNDFKTFNLSHGLVSHPVTREMLWFNQSHLLSLFSGKDGDSPAMRGERSLRTPERMKILEETRPEDRFSLCCYADGKPIEVSVLEEIHQIFDENKFCFKWERGDLLMMDNVSTAHGRNSFEGERLTLATQAQAWPILKK